MVKCSRLCVVQRSFVASRSENRVKKGYQTSKWNEENEYDPMQGDDVTESPRPARHLRAGPTNALTASFGTTPVLSSLPCLAPPCAFHAPTKVFSSKYRSTLERQGCLSHQCSRWPLSRPVCVRSHFLPSFTLPQHLSSPFPGNTYPRIILFSQNN